MKTNEQLSADKAEIDDLRALNRSLDQGEAYLNEQIRQRDAALAQSAKDRERLDEIRVACEADEADLNKMRDGTKLTRAGLVSIIVFQQQELRQSAKDKENCRQLLGEAQLRLIELYTFGSFSETGLGRKINAALAAQSKECPHTEEVEDNGPAQRIFTCLACGRIRE